MSDLFPPDFLEGLASLRIEARRVPKGGRHAEHHARASGAGIEFRDHRGYVPGDDLRRVDWNLYRRFQKLFLRLSDEVRDLPLYLLTDLSASAWLETPPRADAGRRAAAILAAISLHQGDAVSVFPFGARLEAGLESVGTAARIPSVLHFLEGTRPLGATDFMTSLGGFAARRRRPGMAVVISDFFDPDGIGAVTRALGMLAHRLLLVRLARPDDLVPAHEGEIRFADCETGARVDVTVDERARAKYRAAFQAFESGLEEFARERGAGVMQLDVTAPLLPQFSGLFPDGVLRT